MSVTYTLAAALALLPAQGRIFDDSVQDILACRLYPAAVVDQKIVRDFKNPPKEIYFGLPGKLFDDVGSKSVAIHDPDSVAAGGSVKTWTYNRDEALFTAEIRDRDGKLSMAMIYLTGGERPFDILFGSVSDEIRTGTKPLPRLAGSCSHLRKKPDAGSTTATEKAGQ